MTRNEINEALAAYEAAGEKFNAAYAVFAAARDHYFAIPGKATKADDAAFTAAQAEFEAARAEYDVAFLAASELPEVASDDGDDSADQLVLL